MNSKVRTFDAKKNKEITGGIIDGDTYIKRVHESHLMKKFNAYGIQEDIIWLLKDKNITNIKIVSPTATYVTTLMDWLQPGIKVMDYGHGKQRFLPIKYMKELK